MPVSYGLRSTEASLADTSLNLSALSNPSGYEDERKKLYGIIPEDWIYLRWLLVLALLQKLLASMDLKQ